MLGMVASWLKAPEPAYDTGDTATDTEDGIQGKDETPKPASPRADPGPSLVPLDTGMHSAVLHVSEQQRASSQDAPYSTTEPRRHMSNPHSHCAEIIRDLQVEIDQLRIQRTESEAHSEQAQRYWAENHHHQKIAASQEHSRLTNVIAEKDNTIIAMKENESKLRRTLLFLTSEDRCSAADVTALVRELNYEILQVSTAAAEELVHCSTNREGVAAPSDKEGASALTESFISSRFHSQLEVANHKDDFTLLQLAFQAVLCKHCKGLIESWDKDTFRDLSNSLKEMYRLMKEKEPQSVFAQWRALTQRQLNDMVARAKPASTTARLEKWLLIVVTAANIQHSDQVSEWTRSLADKLRAVEAHVDRIRNAIAIEFVSGDFTIAYMRPGKSFNRKEMRDAFESRKDVRGDRVACTTELGLILTKKVTKGDQSHEESLLLLQPQVFLDSTLLELVQP